MIGILQACACFLQNILLAISWGALEVVNLIIFSLSGLLALLLAILPAMPSAPSSSAFDSTALGWIAWFVPAQGIVAGLVAMLVLYLIFLAIKIGLNWVKAL